MIGQKLKKSYDSKWRRFRCPDSLNDQKSCDDDDDGIEKRQHKVDAKISNIFIFKRKRASPSASARYRRHGHRISFGSSEDGEIEIDEVRSTSRVWPRCCSPSCCLILW